MMGLNNALVLADYTVVMKLLHCCKLHYPKNKQNLRIKIELVKVGAVATVYVRLFFRYMALKPDKYCMYVCDAVIMRETVLEPF